MFDYMRLHCNLDLEDNKQVFSHDTLARDGPNPVPSLVTKDSADQNIIKHSFTFEPSLWP